MRTNDCVDAGIEFIATSKDFSRDALFIKERYSIEKGLFGEVQQELGQA
jgi:hypothetical protein